MQARALGQGGVGWPAVTASASLGEVRPGVSDLDHVLSRDAVVRHEVTDRLVPQVVCDGDLDAGPPLRPGPQRHRRIGVRADGQG
ncbi:hypothetical protein ONA92_27130 [Mycobacteroides salmoniphilum]|uniref:hypothetical protein n=1 Tax=Mycobacteroides salmoniphilum TaxID=404941 RepID=UPI0035620005